MDKRGTNDSGSCSKSRKAKRRRTAISKGQLKLRTLPSYFDKECKKDVLKSLEDIESDVKLSKPIRWHRLLPVLRATRVNDKTAPDCLKFVKELLRLFERYRCNNAMVISKVFHVLLSLTGLRFEFMGKYPKFKKFFCIPYGKEQCNVNLLLHAASCANLGLLKLLLRFGIGVTTPDSSMFHILILTCLNHWPCNSGDGARGGESTEGDEISVEHIGWCRAEIEEKLRCNFNSESLKRLDLVFSILDMLIQMKHWGPDYKDHFTECYRLLFDSIPEPYISSVEVEASLQKCLHVSCPRLVFRITEDFKCLLPELAEVPKPRSLQHLCRIQVRQCLRQNLNLPHGVSSVPLPTHLKEYILLNDDGDYNAIHKSVFDYDPATNQQWQMPKSYINIPERDDCVISFFKKLTVDF